MATFKVGQRVKNIVGGSDLPWYVGRFVELLCGSRGPSIPVGAEGTITVVVDYFRVTAYSVAFDCNPEEALCAATELAPLTDDEADAWAADAVRKVTRPQHVEPAVVTLNVNGYGTKPIIRAKP